ncbi:hypothetical protein BD410DRAFT_308940 [Rickenella mellea]|uniref:F-box domain-containing protein n=1 Tax=Rickenella mellea TaxID=50990 RepID=A0A4Y7Q369_9AGAM|nr:hypothetical protein BD410DRAFT_308940 [Rickenella mellea]
MLSPDLNFPFLSHIRIRTCNIFPTAQALLSQLTTVELRFLSSFELHLAEFSCVLHQMRCLQHLSITLEGCLHPSLHVRRLSAPDFRSVPINTLSLIIKDMTRGDVARAMFNALSFLRPSHCTLSLDNLVVNDPLEFFWDGVHADPLVLFPYGLSITVTVYHTVTNGWDPGFDLLAALANSCDIVEEIYIQAPGSAVLGFAAYSDNLVKHYPAFIQLRYCDHLSEDALEKLMKNFLFGEGTGLQSLEIISCVGISVRLLERLHEKFGARFYYRS